MKSMTEVNCSGQPDKYIIIRFLFCIVKLDLLTSYSYDYSCVVSEHSHVLPG